VSAPSGAARSCLPSYEHRASAALIRDYGVIAPQSALSEVYALPVTWNRTPWTAAAGCWALTTLLSANNLTGYLRALAMQAARNRE
jgi:hypothetical protein